MSESLNDVYNAIREAAISKELIVVDNVPTLSKLSIAIWHGSWNDYVDRGARVHILLFYLEKWIYEPESFVEQAIEDYRKKHFIPDEEEEDDDKETEADIGSLEWFQARLEEALIPWSKHNSTVIAS